MKTKSRLALILTAFFITSLSFANNLSDTRLILDVLQSDAFEAKVLGLKLTESDLHLLDLEVLSQEAELQHVGDPCSRLVKDGQSKVVSVSILINFLADPRSSFKHTGHSMTLYFAKDPKTDLIISCF